MPLREVSFDLTGRRFDHAWPALKLAVEYQGGIHASHMGHRSEAGVIRDSRKANDAGLLGWKVLYFTGDDVNDRIQDTLDAILQELQARRITTG